jgi:hypothetical protein
MHSARQDSWELHGVSSMRSFECVKMAWNPHTAHCVAEDAPDIWIVQPLHLNGWEKLWNIYTQAPALAWRAAGYGEKAVFKVCDTK